MADTTLRVPDEPGPVEVKRGRESWKVTRHDAASWLLAQEDLTGLSQQWIDMLGGLGLALKLEPDGRLRMVISRPPQTLLAWLGHHSAGDYEDVKLNLPALTWVLLWRNEQLVESQLYVSERPILSLRDQAHLRYFPFGNVDAQVCWGSAATTHLSVKNPLEVETLFFRSGLNEHLFVGTWLGRGGLKAWAKAHPEETLPIAEWVKGGQTIAQILNMR